MHVSTSSWLRFVGASALAFVALPASAEDNMVLQWNAIASNSIVVVAAKSPPSAAPLFAIVQGAVYDAATAIDGRYAPFAVVAHAVPGASAEAAVATAAHDVLVGRLPAQKAHLDAAYAASLATIPDGDAKTDGIALGAEVAWGWLALRADDGYEAPMPPYDVPPGPGNWERTPPGFADPIAMWLPYLTPFTLGSGDQFRPEPPPSLRSKAWAVDFNEVKLVGAEVIGARIWGGIHYRTACLLGAAGGKKVAHQLLKNSFQKVD